MTLAGARRYRAPSRLPWCKTDQRWIATVRRVAHSGQVERRAIVDALRLLKIAVPVLLPVIAACGDDNGPAAPATNFTATLAGTHEVPPVTTPATGTATLSVSGSQITY